jgi:hypothetical protein
VDDATDLPFLDAASSASARVDAPPVGVDGEDDVAILALRVPG